MAAAPPGRRRSPALIALAVISTLIVVAVALAVIVAFTWFDVSLNDGVGDRSYAPASAGDVNGAYKLGVGDLKLDLSHMSSDQNVDVDASVGIGHLRITVPQDASVALDARVKAGSIDALGRHDDGRDARIRESGGGKLHVKARVGAGNIEVVRAG
jgi:predicted membrane protein